MTERKMERLIKTEIPVGTDVSGVVAFLDSRKIVHSEYIIEKPFGNIDDKPQKYGGKINGFITAGMRDVRSNILVSTDISMVFYFDENKKLMDYTVKEVHTGL
ncbi:MAG TPA: hypothetical protein VNO70_23895 [Blastocatellia bacterium]|nr:hypothetical protein [Blastocatellia bacterium]